MFRKIERTIIDWLETQGLVAYFDDASSEWMLDIDGTVISLTQMTYAIDESLKK